MPLRRADDGAVLNTINTRLDAAIVAFQLDHAEAKVLIVDREFSRLAKDALALAKVKPLLIDYDDPEFDGAGERLAAVEYEDFVAGGDEDFAWSPPRDEWDATLNYTSGTTGDPKGVVYHHRGAACSRSATCSPAACASTASISGPADVPLQRLVLSLDALGGRRHPCLPAPGARAGDVRRHRQSQGDASVRRADRDGDPAQRAGRGEEAAAARGRVLHQAAPPPEAVLAAMKAAGFNVTHLYGLTETYGPATVNEWRTGWDALSPAEQAAKKARQGVRYVPLEALDVRDPDTLAPVPWDGESMGEVMFRGNVVMKGYLKNNSATEKAFAGGWFHSGDLGVIHPDGYIQLKDRSKDIIISGGENISSIEVEDALYKHPAVQAAAVVAKPDEKWGETPCAFVELKPGQTASKDDLIAWCRKHLASYKCPRYVVFAELPKTSTGKIQKFKLRDMAKEV